MKTSFFKTTLAIYSLALCVSVSAHAFGKPKPSPTSPIPTSPAPSGPTPSQPPAADGCSEIRGKGFARGVTGPNTNLSIGLMICKDSARVQFAWPRADLINLYLQLPPTDLVKIPTAVFEKFRTHIDGLELDTAAIADASEKAKLEERIREIKAKADASPGAPFFFPMDVLSSAQFELLNGAGRNIGAMSAGGAFIAATFTSTAEDLKAGKTGAKEQCAVVAESFGSALTQIGRFVDKYFHDEDEVIVLAKIARVIDKAKPLSDAETIEEMNAIAKMFTDRSLEVSILGAKAVLNK